MRDKCRNKDLKITVRLTPHQAYMIGVACKDIGINKSTLIRYILDQFINKYDAAESI